MVKKTVSCYLTVEFLWRFATALHFTIYAIFLRDRGLDLFEANLVNAIYFIAVVLFEVPTGIVADVFGRKVSFVLAIIFYGSGLLIYYDANSFWGCVVGEVVAAIGLTFQSGAYDAWMVDELKFYESSDDYIKLTFSRRSQLEHLGSIAGGLLGAYLGARDIALPWLASALGIFALLPITLLWMKEEHFTPAALDVSSALKEMVKTGARGFSYVRGKSSVHLVIIFSAFLFFGVMAPNMQWQIYFGRFYGSVSGNGWVWCGIGLALFCGARFLPRIVLKYFSSKMNLALGLILAVIGLGIATTTLSSVLGVSLIIFWLQQFFRGGINPTKDAYLNEQINDKTIRATVLSVESLIRHFAGMAGLIVSGLVARHISLEAAWVFSGMIMMLGGLILWRKFKTT